MNLSSVVLPLLLLLSTSVVQSADESIEKKTRIHRLSSTRRAPFDAFVYVNRIPNTLNEDEVHEDLTARIFSRLANQEGRILLKLPPGMNRESYLGFKTFLRNEGDTSVGNCAACHFQPDFTDGKDHIVDASGKTARTVTLRNMKKREIDLEKVLADKLQAAKHKQAHPASKIDSAYEIMKLSDRDVAQLTSFLKLLNDTNDEQFRQLILSAEVLDTSEGFDE